MIGKTNCGSGSGGATGLKVVAYPVADGFPSKAKNNTVGVLSDTPIVDYYISPTEPEHLNGRVWIKVGIYGVEIALNRKGTFGIKLSNAYQSNGTEWLQCQAKVGCKKDGALVWSELIDFVIFYNGIHSLSAKWYGDSFTSGSSSNPSKGIVDAGGIKVMQYRTASSKAGNAFACMGPFDVTSSSKILASVHNVGNYNTANTGIYLARNNSTSTPLVVGGKTYQDSAQVNIGVERTFEVDVSELTGEVYIYVGTTVGNWSGERKMHITKVWSI